MQKQTAKIVAFIGAALGWFAVIAQLYLIITNRVVSVPGTVLRFSATSPLTQIFLLRCVSLLSSSETNHGSENYSRKQQQLLLLQFTLQ